MSAMNSIQLLGLKHTGKSTVGRLWAIRQGWDFYDLDQILELRAGGGRTSRQIYLDEGAATSGPPRTETVPML